MNKSNQPVEMCIRDSLKALESGTITVEQAIAQLK